MFDLRMDKCGITVQKLRHKKEKYFFGWNYLLVMIVLYVSPKRCDLFIPG